jgi:pimeloyl-ACP methyl ester carboxylesterase
MALLRPRALADLSGEVVEPFVCHVPAAELDDLARRLDRVRWPTRETTDDWSQGVPLREQVSLIEHWRQNYDWRACEARLNRFRQNRTEIDRLGIHFIHVRSKHEHALPILISHGWPSSILDFLDVIEPLTDPTAHGGDARDAFHVVIPSLPGFAFSDKPSERGWNSQRIAAAWAVLMQRLGYTRYVAQGGDWGAVITTHLAQQRPPGLFAIHLNMPQVVPDPLPESPTPEEQQAIDAVQRFKTDGFGYYLEQATRPQTLAYGLADSPSGQAAWLYQIIHEGTFQSIPRDRILDQITLYWLTDTAGSSARLYLEQNAIAKGLNWGVVELPVGCSIFPHELYKPPRAWAERFYPNLFYWNELDRGGHFAALETPDLFTAELRACFRAVRG